MTYPLLDTAAIRARIARTGPFSLPRWVAIDLANLLAEVDRLRVAPESDRTVALLREQAAELRAERDALREQVADLREERREDTAQIIGWLRAHAADTPPGPVSPVRRTEQLFATRLAGIIERGEHRVARPEQAPEQVAG